jgi:HK97 family phage major capsid protein
MGTMTAMDAIFTQMTNIATGAFIQPDALVINPTDWMHIQLSKTTFGSYLGTGPWAYPQQPTLWGLPVAVTPSIAAGTALVGGFRLGAQEFNRGGVRVEMSNSHQDFFVKNLIAIRAEMRQALAIYRPQAFGLVTAIALQRSAVGGGHAADSGDDSADTPAQRPSRSR